MPRERRVWMPVRDYWGRHLGGTGRSYNGHPRKVLTYRADTTVPFLAWYPTASEGTLVVEDQVSALTGLDMVKADYSIRASIAVYIKCNPVDAAVCRLGHEIVGTVISICIVSQCFGGYTR